MTLPVELQTNVAGFEVARTSCSTLWNSQSPSDRLCCSTGHTIWALRMSERLNHSNGNACCRAQILVAGVGFEPTCDRLMRPTSYRIALPRDELGSRTETRTRNSALSERRDNLFHHSTIARLQFWRTSKLCYTLTLGREVDLIT